MDINLKNNKNLNLRMLLLGISVGFLPTLLGYSFFYYLIGIEFITLLDILFSICLLLNVIMDKALILKETFIIRVYSKLFIEVRILLAIILIYSMFDFFNVWVWGNIFRNADTLMEFTIYLILMYLVLIDLYKLYLFNKADKFENFTYEKSMFYIFLKFIKESFFTKSTSSKIVLIILLFIIYDILIYVTGYLTFNSYFFRRYGIFLFCIALSTTVLIILLLIYVSSDINKIELAIRNIMDGNYNKINAKGLIFFKDFARNLISIENGLNKAIDKAVKSERMRSELITNVSHDLKSPLTSIINYVDLLDNSNISNEKSKLYLGILKERSQRLKILIEDLFEASKAASGTLEMHMEYLDPVALIRQTLGEFDDKIKTSNLNFIKRIPESKLSMYADGNKAFRIFQNLISNIIKYSLQGTRVYIDVTEVNEYISITFKNISKYPLNFTEEEILERFKRGDSSRTTEGSGLGLSIAKSLTELQGGLFKLSFDGDLFKVTILFKKTEILI